MNKNRVYINGDEILFARFALLFREQAKMVSRIRQAQERDKCIYATYAV